MVRSSLKTRGVDYSTLSRETIVEIAQANMVRADKYRIERNRLRLEIERLKKLVYVDALTKVGNRAAFDKALRNEIARAKRARGPVSLCILDLDHFKRINDKYGHPTGDKVLAQMGILLRTHARSTDFVGRIGGEEFAFILPHTSLENAALFLERFRSIVVEHLVVKTTKGSRLIEVRATASFGLVSWNESETVETLIERADSALYRAKEEGRNRLGVA